MYSERLSISLPKALCVFINEYKAQHHCKSTSEVIQAAIKNLQQKELEKCYRVVRKEIDPAFEITSSDGLNDETW